MINKLRTHSEHANTLYSNLTKLENPSIFGLRNMDFAVLISEIKLMINKYSFDYSLFFDGNVVERFERAILALIK